MSFLASFLKKYTTPQNAFIALISTIFAGIFGGFYFNTLTYVVLPFAFLYVLLILADIKKVYWLFFLLLPFSLEFEVGGGLATDMPTEPILVSLMAASIALFLADPKAFPKGYIKHPLIILLLLHIAWIGICSLYSPLFLPSFKYFLAKTWYITVFIFFTGYCIKKPQDLKPIVWSVTFSFCIIIIRAIFLHAQNGFSFESVGYTMTPFFRNHVNYAVMMAVFLPYIWYAKRWYAKGSIKRMLLNIGIFIFLLGILHAYTRAAYLSLLLIPIAVFIIKKRLIKYIAFSVITLIILFSLYYIPDNHYLTLAPDYETTIFHKDFDDHLWSTFEGKDVSSMERIYRWVAAVNMSVESPWVGFGPSNFATLYKSYTVSAFSTYVSDNPEGSGTHNYFLMVLAEQGYIGLIIFLAFVIYLLIYAEKVYANATDPNHRQLTLVIGVSLTIIIFNNLLGDLLEVDKIGTWFFLAIPLLINLEKLTTTSKQSLT